MKMHVWMLVTSWKVVYTPSWTFREVWKVKVFYVKLQIFCEFLEKQNWVSKAQPSHWVLVFKPQQVVICAHVYAQCLLLGMSFQEI